MNFKKFPKDYFLSLIFVSKDYDDLLFVIVLIYPINTNTNIINSSSYF